jgi:hypothetical protein
MALPLPKVVADVGPGGPLVTSNMGRNALTQSNLENQIKGVQAQYAPLTTQAEAASKLAYANLMGPQFMAKLFGNTDVLANIPENQKGAILQKLLSAGGGGASGNSMMNMPSGIPNGMNPTPANNMMTLIANKIKSMISGQGDQGGQQQPMQQGMQQTPPMQNQLQQFAQAYPDVAKAMQDQYQRTGQAQFTIPQVQNQPVATQPAAPTFAENRGTYGGIVKEGEERGKLRADALNDMGKEYQASMRLNDSYEEMKNLINDPAFQKMRANIPFFQNMQMNALSKIGTPYEQEMIGTFKSAAQKILANAVNSFEGRKFVGEFKTTNDMKINDNDTFNTIVGKMQAGMLLNNYDRQRVAIASQLMKTNHMDQQEALEAADKQLDRKQIENDIKNLVRITIKNKKTGEVKSIPIHEARQMGVPNV